MVPKDIEAEAEVLRSRDTFSAALATFSGAIASFGADAKDPLKTFHRMQRYRIWLALICNYYSWLDGIGGKPTLTLLQAQDLGSSRQAATVAAALKAGRYLRTDPDHDDARVGLLVPVPAMVLAFSRTTQCYLDLHDVTTNATDLWQADADLLGRLIAAAVREAPSYQAMLERFPLVFGFSCQDCGFLLLCAVMREALTDCEAAPLGRELPLSLDNLTRSLGVSRAHVGSLLAAARKAGYFAIKRGRLSAYPSPVLMREFAEFVSINAVTFHRLYSCLRLDGQSHRSIAVFSR